MDKTESQKKLQKIGARLKLARQNANLTREAMAQQCGASISTVLRWERGDTDIALLGLLQYLEILSQHGVNITIDTLLDYNKPFTIDISTK